jgi:ABC-type oligopeptide transport system ATPase subunit
VTLFQRLQKEHRFAFLFIAHDLSMVRFLCDRVGVMRAGRLVETAPADELFAAPRHPYTKALLSATPVLNFAKEPPTRYYTRAKNTLPAEWSAET